MMSHSPLRMFNEFHNKCVLLSGQGPVDKIAERIGFTNTVTIDQIRSAFPNLDMVDHQRRPKSVSLKATFLLRSRASEGGGMVDLAPLDFVIWHFPITFLAKKAFFLVSRGKMKFHHFCHPWEKPTIGHTLKKTFWCPACVDIYW